MQKKIISAISISERNPHKIATLNIVLDFDGMKFNMSAIIKCKENIGSSYLFFQKTYFSMRKKRGNLILVLELLLALTTLNWCTIFIFIKYDDLMFSCVLFTTFYSLTVWR